VVHRAPEPDAIDRMGCGAGALAGLRLRATRAIEVVLAATGLGFTVLGGDSKESQALFLGLWGSVAVGYLVVGGVHVRRQRGRDVSTPEAGARWLRGLASRRFSFFFTVAASVTGLGAALDVLYLGDESEVGTLLKGLGVIVVICAWMLLHVGYAYYYTQWSADLRFPNTETPQLIDFLYFGFTIGVAFATSDVEVRSRPLRWHVMVHSVVSFFYNLIVLAIAVSIITGR
jgi:uncharacterized membrane protein